MQSDQSQWAVIAMCLRGRAPDIIGKVKPHHFDARFRPAFEAAMEIFERHGKVDDVLFLDRLEDVGEGLGLTAEQLHMEMLAYPANDESLETYIHTLKRGAISRRLTEFASDVARISRDEPPESAISMVAQKLSELEEGEESESCKGIRKILYDFVKETERRFESDGEIIGLPTGFKDLDTRWMGMKPGNLIVIAGRPAMGKSTLALNIAAANAMAGNSVLFFSMEMDHDEMGRKLVSAAGRLSHTRLSTGKLIEQDWPKLSAGSSLLSDTSLFIDESPNLSVVDMKSRAYQIKAKNDLHLIVVDYLQLMDGPGFNREAQISGISRGLKKLAKEMGVPIIAVSQLNRSCEQRPNKRPINADLRDSGAIEQDANIITFVYRDEVYNEDSPLKGTAELITRKFRGGKIGTDCVAFNGEHQRFDDLSYQPDVESIVARQEQKPSRGSF